MRSLLFILSISLLFASCANNKDLVNLISQKRVDKCVKEGDPITCNEIGSELARSYNSHERKMALQFFTHGCQKNYAKSCNLLGDEYAYHYQNRKKAKAHYLRGCEVLKNAESCYYLAHNFRRMGEDKDFVAYIEKACEMDERFACYDLGRHMLEQNRRKDAINVFHKSCKLGYEKACQKAEALDY